MVKALHRAGIEVILDVVYNHTAEGNHLGPTLAFRGVDNEAYYRLVPGDPRHYMDFTGTGNSLNPVNPSVLRLIMDSLRYFVTECHVDGFRFDLASALARELYDVDRLSAFFDVIHQDPVLSQVKLIAEPWDVGPGRLPGRELPDPLVGVERHVPGHDARLLAGHTAVAEFARRFTGSSDLYQADGRHPVGVDQLRDLPRRLHAPRPRVVRPEAQRGEPRGEPRRLATTTARGTAASRGRPTTPRSTSSAIGTVRNFLATLLLSQGTPMLLAGDERRNTQHGNNNAYCQDNELSWLDWELGEARGRCSASPSACCASVRSTPSSGAPPSSRARSGRARARRTSGGSGPTAAR